ncbi:hypothetical protein FACS189472_10670 [Alphaproteobacteria bacterium]|nr:hypothetical protein FACS189472_10670 [Alphaproteobacteria bacterium]
MRSSIFNLIVAFSLLVGCSEKSIDTERPQETQKAVSIKAIEDLEKLPKDEINVNQTPHSEMMKILDELIVRSCRCHCSTEDQIFDAVRKIVTENQISNQDLAEYMDDFSEIRNKIYDIVEFTCQLEFARKTYAEKIDLNIILDCVNKKSFENGLMSREEISEPIIKAKRSIKDELQSVGCGTVWKDYAKYNFVLNKVFGRKTEAPSYTKLPSERYENYMKIVEKVYSFACDSIFENCKYSLARNFSKHGVNKKIICKIFVLSDEEFEDFIKS